MTDHLPECPAVAGWNCICIELRACRERTLTEARDEVAAIHVWDDGQLAIRNEVLAAIDALCNPEQAPRSSGLRGES